MSDETSQSTSLAIEDNRLMVNEFEMKDVGAFSQPDIINTLNEAMKNREASYGILVVKSVESLPASVGWFNEYSGNQLVCALSSEHSEEPILHEEIMFIAYKWAKARTLLETIKEERIDAVFVRDRIAAIQAKLSSLKAIRTQCSNIEKSSDEIKALLKDAEREIREELASILTGLSAKRKPSNAHE
jgi:hypothetical protein